MTDSGEEPRFLDGPKFIKWLTEEEKVNPSLLTDSQKRRWYDWGQGQRADFYSDAVDRILTDNYISSRLIPDEIWSDDQRKRIHKKKSLPPDKQKARKAEGRMLIMAEIPPKEIAVKLDVSIATVRIWKRQLRKEGVLA